ncbi:MAG: diguanylate cyclase [Fibrobacter sp.]|nr:diguanylate cyclase [Fibrobacter sp.]
MQQRTYEISQGKSLAQALKIIGKSKAYQNAFDKLLIVYEPNCDEQFLDKERMTIQKYLPDIKVIAMTTFGPVSSNFIYQKNTRLTLLLFDRSKIDIFEANGNDKHFNNLGVTWGSKFQSIPDLKGLLFFSSSATLNPASLVQELQAANSNVPIFGAQAGTRTLGNDESKIFSAKQVYDKGVIVAALSGEDLEIFTQYTLGWKPLGRTHVITSSDSHGVVSTVDGKSVKELYDKYLDIPFDEDFPVKACAFPLLFKSGNTYTAKIPIRYTEDEKLIYPSELKIGTKVWFSYSKPEYLLKETLIAVNRIAEFQPQGLMVFACVNRQLFMGAEKTTREHNYFLKVLPEVSSCYGYGEILQTKNGGGVFTSSIVSAAFREGPADTDKIIKPIIDRKLISKKNLHELSDQLVSFLEATTEDLNSTIDQLADLAEHDQLTGLFNRRKINEILEYELRKRRSDGDFSILMYDIDFFKKVNDEFGHQIGDQVLVHVSNLIRNSIRGCDVLGRWGGEEFICILPNTRIAGAKALAERMRHLVESIEFPPLKKLTISLGITEVLASDSYESLLVRMDNALYDAKKNGRNQFCIH